MNNIASIIGNILSLGGIKKRSNGTLVSGDSLKLNGKTTAEVLAILQDGIPTSENTLNKLKVYFDNLAGITQADKSTYGTLQAQLNNIRTILNSDNINLDTLQEIVDFVENNRLSIEALASSYVTLATTQKINGYKTFVAPFKVIHSEHENNMSFFINDDGLDFRKDIPNLEEDVSKFIFSIKSENVDDTKMANATLVANGNIEIASEHQNKNVYINPNYGTSSSRSFGNGISGSSGNYGSLIIGSPTQMKQYLSVEKEIIARNISIQSDGGQGSMISTHFNGRANYMNCYPDAIYMKSIDGSNNDNCSKVEVEENKVFLSSKASSTDDAYVLLNNYSLQIKKSANGTVDTSTRYDDHLYADENGINLSYAKYLISDNSRQSASALNIKDDVSIYVENANYHFTKDGLQFGDMPSTWYVFPKEKGAVGQSLSLSSDGKSMEWVDSATSNMISKGSTYLEATDIGANIKSGAYTAMYAYEDYFSMFAPYYNIYTKDADGTTKKIEIRKDDIRLNNSNAHIEFNNDSNYSYCYADSNAQWGGTASRILQRDISINQEVRHSGNLYSINMIGYNNCIEYRALNESTFDSTTITQRVNEITIGAYSSDNKAKIKADADGIKIGTSGNEYLMPTAKTNTAGKVMVTDANGNLSWGDNLIAGTINDTLAELEVV